MSLKRPSPLVYLGPLGFLWRYNLYYVFHLGWKCLKCATEFSGYLDWFRGDVQSQIVFFNFKIFAFWNYGQLNTGKFLTQITLWLTLGLPSPPLSLPPCVLTTPAWAHTGMPCWCAARALSCREAAWRGVLQRPPQPFFAAGVGIDVRKKKTKTLWFC